jgi:threonine/homoserine/homoserine lactone efflux protein
MLLGLTFITTGLLWSVTVACFSSFATAKLRQSPKLALWINRFTGVVFIALGLKLFRAKLTSNGSGNMR